MLYSLAKKSLSIKDLLKAQFEKTIQVYDILADIMSETAFSLFISSGAEDKQLMQRNLERHGMAIRALIYFANPYIFFTRASEDIIMNQLIQRFLTEKQPLRNIINHAIELHNNKQVTDDPLAFIQQILNLDIFKHIFGIIQQIFNNIFLASEEISNTLLNFYYANNENVELFVNEVINKLEDQDYLSVDSLAAFDIIDKINPIIHLITPTILANIMMHEAYRDIIDNSEVVEPPVYLYHNLILIAEQNNQLIKSSRFRENRRAVIQIPKIYDTRTTYKLTTLRMHGLNLPLERLIETKIELEPLKIRSALSISPLTNLPNNLIDRRLSITPLTVLPAEISRELSITKAIKPTSPEIRSILTISKVIQPKQATIKHSIGIA